MKPFDLVRSGLALVPVPYKEKGPKAPGWNLPENAITTQQATPSLNGKNVGLAHAYCTPTPTCAIDLDNYKVSKKWLRNEGVDLDLLLYSPDAAVIWSGKENSLKLLYRLPKEVGALQSKQMFDEAGRMMLEFRCAAKNGTTLQDLLPPSVHPSGSQYQWVGSGSPLAISTLPERLLDVWLNIKSGNRSCKQSARQSGGPCTKSAMNQLHAPRPDTPRERAVVEQLLSYVSADCGRDLWRDIVWAILSTGWPCAVDLAKKWSESAPTRYDDAAFWTLVQTFDPTYVASPTLGTVYFHARQGGWIG
jgi:hypothetical protein